MTAKTDLRWLHESDYDGASQRFVKFCKDDIKRQAERNIDFELEIYESSIRHILKKLDDIAEQKKEGVS
ncbi:MAG: hypothetical protein KAG28_09555 [Cocleimonas sp.]|nr:hypothetical protein [Cocleimonas sp.]